MVASFVFLRRKKSQSTGRKKNSNLSPVELAGFFHVLKEVEIDLETYFVLD